MGGIPSAGVPRNECQVVPTTALSAEIVAETIGAVLGGETISTVSSGRSHNIIKAFIAGSR